MATSSGISQARLDRLADGITTVAVTGTNGKTTTTGMVAAIARTAGRRVARVTTLGMWVDDTQTADDGSMASFVRTLEHARDVGADVLALEVTSRALAGGFASRWPAHVAVFTNLTPDHLDRHGSPEAYLAAKAQLFVHLRPRGTAVLNAADPASALLREVLPDGTRVSSYLGAAQPPIDAGGDVDLAATGSSSLPPTMRVTLSPGRLATALDHGLELATCGEFNVDNALAAALAADALGLPASATTRALAAYGGERGRFQIISHAPTCIVDFAHTPDALRRALHSARALLDGRGAQGRLLCVMGCGGERDVGKRGPMGALADELADRVWLTTDNPRGEDPRDIAAQVRTGAAGKARWVEQPDRREAIAAAVRAAGDADLVLVAGRGHEETQDLGAEQISGSDEQWLRRALARR
ncbi:MAG: UDP-N-acetylmuramyl-tripeptide synthetase [Myxococcales bacterium]|jgi:UDP-N-acetylmuramoyl-L-alanyl-D-glutamate--2,6-diaminopimelate ligase